MNPNINFFNQFKEIIDPNIKYDNYGNIGVVTIDLKPLHNCLMKNNFPAIIQDPSLFFAAYCKSLTAEYTFGYRKDPYVTNIGEAVQFDQSRDFYKVIPVGLEKVRTLFLEGFHSHQNFKISIVQLPENGEWRHEGIYITKSFETFDFASSENEKIQSLEYYYCHYFKPALRGLTDLCGAIYKETNLKQKLQRSGCLDANETKILLIEVQWKREVQNVYKIAPKVISKAKDLRSMLYEDYLTGKTCDFQLVASNGKSIKMHSIILRKYGGEVFDKLFDSGMTELKEKTVVLQNYSENTLRSFAEFLYLGGDVFYEKIKKLTPNFDITELFSLADQYQIPTLVDCSTNLLSFFATIEDAATIYEAAITLNNDYLKELHKVLIAGSIYDV